MQNFLKFSLSVFLLTTSAAIGLFMINGGTVRASEPKMLNNEGTYQMQMQTTIGSNGKYRFEVLCWNTQTGENRWYFFDNYDSYTWKLEPKQMPAMDF